MGWAGKVLMPMDEHILGKKLSARGTAETLVGKVTGDKNFAHAIARPESLLKNNAPVPAPLAPLPIRDNPAVLAAREKTRLAQLNSRRSAANLSGGLGETGVNRPRASRVFGE